MRTGAKKRLRCKTCKNYLQYWETSYEGKKRLYCRNCKTTITCKNKRSHSYWFSLLKQYVLHVVTYEMLFHFSGYSIRHLQNKFHQYLSVDPPPLSITPQPLSMFPCLLIDGLWFGRYFVLIGIQAIKTIDHPSYINCWS